MTEYSVPQFDRSPDLAELLPPATSTRLVKALTGVLGTHWQILDERENVVLGQADPSGTAAQRQAALVVELEPVGFLRASEPGIDLEWVAQLISSILFERWRYRMSADLHFQSSLADYEELQRRNDALQISEARYRSLAESLEQRVEEQVMLIRKQQREIYQAEKLASVGQLAAGVAHEINNPIGFVKSNSATARAYLDRIQAMLRQLKDNGSTGLDTLWQKYDVDFLMADFQDLLDESEQGINRVASIIADLREFSGVDVAETKQADINDCVRVTSELARMHAQFNKSIQFDLQELPPLTCQVASINQAIMQLVLNALWATEQSGEVLIRTYSENQKIQILVKDTGCGIPSSIQPRILEPFFTTRPVGKGKGLGLSVCLDVVQAHGGSLTFTSTEGQGSEFVLSLPIPSTKNPSTN